MHQWHTIRIPGTTIRIPGARRRLCTHQYVSLAHQCASLAPNAYYASTSMHSWHTHTHPWHHELTTHPSAASILTHANKRILWIYQCASLAPHALPRRPDSRMLPTILSSLTSRRSSSRRKRPGGKKLKGGGKVRRKKRLRGVKGGNTLRRKKKVRLLYDDIVMPCYLLCVALCALVHSFVSCSRFLAHAFLRFSAFLHYYILELVRAQDYHEPLTAFQMCKIL